jgi:hypothetical protein
MPVGQDLILGPKGANVISNDGKLTPSARQKFILEVLALSAGGNASGLGLSRTSPLLPIPIPPIPGPSLPGPMGSSPLFWFKPDPFALLSAPYITRSNSQYQKLIIDGLYEPLAKMLNVAGKTSLGPVFDPTIFLDTGASKFRDLRLPDLPGILVQLVTLGGLAQILPSPGTAAKIILAADFGIADPKITADLIPLILASPIPALPTIVIPTPPIPSIPNPGISNFFLPEFFLGLFKLPLQIFPALIGELISISIDPLALIGKIVTMMIDLILKLLNRAEMLVAPLTLFAASICVLIKNLAGMILCDLIGILFGTGLMVKIVGSLAGLT